MARAGGLRYLSSGIQYRNVGDMKEPREAGVANITNGMSTFGE